MRISPKDKINAVIGIALILTLIGIIYPSLGRASEMFIEWLPAVLYGIMTTAIAGALLYKVAGNYFDNMKFVVFGIGVPFSFFLIILIKLFFF